MNGHINIRLAGTASATSLQTPAKRTYRQEEDIYIYAILKRFEFLCTYTANGYSFMYDEASNIIKVDMDMIFSIDDWARITRLWVCLSPLILACTYLLIFRFKASEPPPFCSILLPEVGSATLSCCWGRINQNLILALQWWQYDNVVVRLNQTE